MKPRILHVIDHTGEGGAQVVIAQYIRSLNDQYDFAVAVLGYSGRFTQEYRSLGVEVLECGNAATRWNPFSIITLMGYINKWKPDLIHTHLFKANVIGTIAARIMNCTTVLHDHMGVFPNSMKNYHHYFISVGVLKLYYILFQIMLNSVDKVIVLTDEMYNEMFSYYRLDRNKLLLLPNAVGVPKISDHPQLNSFRQTLPLPDETVLLAMVGRLEPEKDWWTFLRVAERLNLVDKQKYYFLIIGTGSEENSLCDYVSEHKLENVLFLGYRDDVQEIFTNVDICLLTSIREPFGIVILEAMAAGCPVISTRSGGPEYIIEDGRSGYLVNIGDDEQFVQKIITLLRDPEEKKKLTQRAHKVIQEHFSLEVISEKLSTMYEELLF